MNSYGQGHNGYMRQGRDAKGQFGRTTFAETPGGTGILQRPSAADVPATPREQCEMAYRELEAVQAEASGRADEAMDAYIHLGGHRSDLVEPRDTRRDFRESDSRSPAEQARDEQAEAERRRRAAMHYSSPQEAAEEFRAAVQQQKQAVRERHYIRVSAPKPDGPGLRNLDDLRNSHGLITQQIEMLDPGQMSEAGHRGLYNALVAQRDDVRAAHHRLGGQPRDLPDRPAGPLATPDAPEVPRSRMPRGERTPPQDFVQPPSAPRPPMPTSTDAPRSRMPRGERTPPQDYPYRPPVPAPDPAQGWPPSDPQPSAPEAPRRAGGLRGLFRGR